MLEDSVSEGIECLHYVVTWKIPEQARNINSSAPSLNKVLKLYCRQNHLPSGCIKCLSVGLTVGVFV